MDAAGTSAHGRKGRYIYYACSTRYKYGRACCAGQRLSKERLEHAVLAQLATIYRDGQLINDALAQAFTLRRHMCRYSAEFSQSIRPIWCSVYRAGQV
jgi:hypothetical protein